LKEVDLVGEGIPMLEAFVQIIDQIDPTKLTIEAVSRLDSHHCTLKRLHTDMLPGGISVLHSILCMDDLSCLPAESVTSEEGVAELVQVSKRESRDYLSVDLLKYFIAFNGFAAFLLFETPPETYGKSPIKEWYLQNHGYNIGGLHCVPQ
jgi:hypothetical protein